MRSLGPGTARKAACSSGELSSVLTDKMCMGKKKQGDIPEAADEKKFGRFVSSGRAGGNPAMRTWLTGQGRTKKWEGKCGQSEGARMPGTEEELQESGKLNLDNQSHCRIRVQEVTQSASEDVSLSGCLGWVGEDTAGR